MSTQSFITTFPSVYEPIDTFSIQKMESQPNESTLGNDEAIETTEFIDTDALLAGSWGEISDPTFAIAATPEVSLPGWFKRPRLLANYTWTGSLSLELDPWALFFNTPDVLDKTKYFHMWHGNLKLRIVVNGNPFLYGRSVIGYIPLYTTNDAAARAMINFPNNSHPKVSYLSQTLSEWIDPSTTHTIEMELPFLHPKNWARFYNEATTVDGDDIDHMGKIFIESIVDLVNASSGTSDTVTVSIFGYFDNLEMAVPSALPAAWILEGKQRRRANIQTGEIKEAQEGKLVVSTVASNIAEAAGYLTKVPVIGPFAMATEIGATAVSSIAKIFGFSSPLQLADEMPISIKPYSNMAFTTVANTATKISVDPLNEVTIDPRVTGGCSDDDLIISQIAEREGFLTNVPWDASVTPVSNRATLCRIGVTPHIYAVDHNLVQQCREPLPCSFAVMPFKYWRGSMKYRFEVVASQYHRGKVVIFYEPSLNAQTVLDATTNLDFAKHKTIVVDLEELNGLEVVVPWATSRPFAKVGSIPGTTTVPYNYFPAYPLDPAVLITALPDETNGFLEVRVLNQLTSVADPATDISINVYASCEQLEVARPENLPLALRGTPGIVPAAWLLESKEVSSAVAASETKRHAILPDHSPPDLTKVVFGENIISFRALLKRYTENLSVSGATATTHIQTQFAIYPQVDAWTPSTTVTTNLSQIDNLHLVNYLAPAYVGIRGGFRHIYDPKPVSEQIPNFAVNNLDVSSSTVAIDTRTRITAGGHIFRRETNSAISISVPYYSSNRFYPAGNDTFIFNKAYTHAIVADGYFAPTNELPGVSGSCDVKATSTDNTIRVYMAAADDFSLIHFIAAPPMLFPNPP